MKPQFSEPRLTEFQGWQNDMEYLADEEECKRRTAWAIAMYRKRELEQRKPVPRWERLLLAVAFLTAATAIFVELWMSL